jgi:hypothetical protein
LFKVIRPSWRKDVLTRFTFLVTVTLVIALLTPGTSCGIRDSGQQNPISTTVSSGQIPVITPQNIRPDGFDLPGDTTEIKATRQEGGILARDALSINVPPQAMLQDGIVSVKEFTEPPPLYSPPASGELLPVAVSISRVYDLGPAGIQFEKPVQVTVPYDKTLLSSDADTSKIALTYYNGRDWVVAGGLVNREKGTVTVAMKSFPGEVISVVVILGGVIISTVGYAGWKAYEQYKGDPISNKNAKEYVLPNDPVVADYTKRAGIFIYENGKPKWVPMEDPSNPGKVNPEFTRNAGTGDVRIGFDGAYRGASYPTFSNDGHWVKPDKFLSGNKAGDCTCVAMAYLSMLRRLGIKAYAVDGYKSNTGQGAARHTWIEFYLNGKTYYYDNDEGITPLEDVESNLKRPTGLAREGYMWDENGQERYSEEWWKSLDTNTPTGLPVKKYILNSASSQVRNVTADTKDFFSNTFKIIEGSAILGPGGGQFVVGVCWGGSPNRYTGSLSSVGFWSSPPAGLNPGDPITIKLEIDPGYDSKTSAAFQETISVIFNKKNYGGITWTNSQTQRQVTGTVTFNLPADFAEPTLDIEVASTAPTGDGSMVYHYILNSN